jgi:hypothetical protein
MKMKVVHKIYEALFYCFYDDKDYYYYYYY